MLKQAYADAIVGASSQSAQNMLRHEAHILKQLEALPFLPRSFALVEDHAMLWLAMEYIEGTLLKHYIEAVTRQSSIVPNETILAWMQELAGMLAQLHQHGIVYRDLKSVNTIVSPDGHLRLIDFGISYDLTSSDAPFLGGSPGYASPQQRANEPAAITDDMYSFGALCYFLATGADPALAPDTTLLLSRPLAEMNPLLPAHLRYVIARCLAPDPGDRFPCMQDVLATLQDRHIWVGGEKEEKEDSLERAQRRYLRYAQELCETLEVAVQTVVDGKIGPAGIQLSPPGSTSVVLRDLGSGMAGVLLVLCEFVQHMQSLPLRAVVRAGADWLLRSQPLEGPILPGLYIGEAGVGLALLRAGQILADQSLITGATQQAARVAASPFTYPDIFHGTAGRLKFSLLLWYATKEGEYVDEALRAGNALLAQAEEARDGGLYWRIPQGYGNLSGKVYLGYGHGVAGIADALLDAYQASGQDVYLDAAHRAAAWLLQRAMPVGEQQQGLGWPEIVFGQEEKIEGKQVCAPFWCHGANGIGHLFLRMAREQSHTQYLDVASKAAQAVAQGTRWSGPSRCHGLAGSIEFLLDVYEVTKEEQWFTSAFTFAHILEAYATEREEQRLWLSEPPEVITPGLLTGYAGIAATFLRIGETGTPMEPHFPRIY